MSNNGKLKLRIVSVSCFLDFLDLEISLYSVSIYETLA